MSTITVNETGVYNITFSAQLNKNGDGPQDASIWFKKNGSPVTNSCTDVHIATSPGELNVSAWNFFIHLNAGESVQIAWSATGANIELYTVAARVSPTRPGIPSIIVTVNKVG